MAKTAVETYLYVAHRDGVASVANNRHVKEWVIVDQETGLIVIDFHKQAVAKRAMARIIKDNPTRDDMMRAGGRYMRGPIRDEFGH